MVMLSVTSPRHCSPADLASSIDLNGPKQASSSAWKALGRRRTDLEREQATALAEATTLQVKAARAARFRRLSTGFKDLQVQIRSDAATKLAENTLALHRRLSERDEFASLTIDPAHYAVQVVPRDLGE